VINASGFKNETQNKWELDQFTDLLCVHKVTFYCELGVYAGTTFLEGHKRLREFHGPDVLIEMVAIEQPSNQGAFAHLNFVVLPEIRKDPNTSVNLFVGNSTDRDIVEDVYRLLDEGRYNGVLTSTHNKACIFIDGDHSYVQSKDDYLAYEGMFDLVAFNDVSPRTVQKQLAKHGKDVATVYHLFDTLTLHMSKDDYVMFDDFISNNPRGIGVFL